MMRSVSPAFEEMQKRLLQEHGEQLNKEQKEEEEIRRAHADKRMRKQELQQINGTKETGFKLRSNIADKDACSNGDRGTSSEGGIESTTERNRRKQFHYKTRIVCADTGKQCKTREPGYYCRNRLFHREE